MAWPELARLLLRPEARRLETWRGRWVFGFWFVAAGFWAGVAPQVNFSLGERLHLAFETIAGMGVCLALLAGFRFAPRADTFVKAQFAEGVVLFVRAANELLAIAPIFLLLLALQSVAPTEVVRALAMILGALIFATALAVCKGPTLLGPIAIFGMMAMPRRTFFEMALISVYAGHLYFKARVALEMSRAMRSPNVDFEMAAPLDAGELCELRQRSFRLGRPFIFGLAILNLGILLMANFWPIKLEEKLPLGLVLSFGIGSLFLDTFALKWRGMLKGSPVSALAVVLGIPWAVAWAFAALHTGEAFTMNEGAAYFFVWTALGSTLSWLVGSSAKQKLLRDFRVLVGFDRGL